MQIFVGSIEWEVTSADLRPLFEQYGTVANAKIILDRETGESRGFGFVEMDDSGEATDAINGLNGFTFKGKVLRVNEAHSRNDSRYIYQQHHHGGGVFRDHDHYHSHGYVHYAHHWK